MCLIRGETGQEDGQAVAGGGFKLSAAVGRAGVGVMGEVGRSEGHYQGPGGYKLLRDA